MARRCPPGVFCFENISFFIVIIVIIVCVFFMMRNFGGSGGVHTVTLLEVLWVHLAEVVRQVARAALVGVGQRERDFERLPAQT